MLRAGLEGHPYAMGPKLSGLPSLFKEVSNAAERRNDIAHGMAINQTINGQITGWFLCPPYHATSKRPGVLKATQGSDFLSTIAFGSYAFNAEQIEKFAEGFRSLSLKSNDYVIAADEHWQRQRNLRIQAMLKQANGGE